MLVKTEPGKAFEVLENLKRWALLKRDGKEEEQGESYEDYAHILEAWVISGEYDVIVKAEAVSVHDLFHMITDIVKHGQNSPGPIQATNTILGSPDGVWH